MHTAEQSIVVDAPISEVYRRWSDLTSFPSFMDSVESVTRTGQDSYHWKTSVGPLTQEFDASAAFTPDRSISWQSTSGPTNNGTVNFTPEGQNRTRIDVKLQYEPSNPVAKIGAQVTDQMDANLKSALQKFATQVNGVTSTS